MLGRKKYAFKSRLSLSILGAKSVNISVLAQAIPMSDSRVLEKMCFYGFFTKYIGQRLDQSSKRAVFLSAHRQSTSSTSATIPEFLNNFG